MSKARGKKETEKAQGDNLEYSLKRLEEIVETLEQGNIPLNDAMKMYEEGVQLSKQCLDKLNQTELKLKRLSKDVDGSFELTDDGIDE